MSSRSPLSFVSRLVAYSVLGALVLELLLRTFYLSPSNRVTDPETGPQYEADRDILVASEGLARNHTNSLGLLDDEILSTKPRLRVLLLGDSFVEARQISHERRMDTVAERLLGPEVEIINAGHAGWGPVNSIPFLRRHLARLDPDVLVLAVSDDDVNQLTDGGHGRLVRQGDGWAIDIRRFSTEESHLSSLVRAVARRSSLVTLIRRRVGHLSSIETARLSAKFSRSSSAGPGGGGAGGLEAEPGMLSALFEPFVATGRPILILYLPRGSYFRWGASRESTPFARQLQSYTKAHGIYFLDPTSRILEHFDRTHEPSHGFQNSILGTGHFNAVGHRLLGEILAKKLEEIAP